MIIGTCENGFRPLTGISLFLLWQWLLHRFRLSGFRPLTGISLFLFGLVKTLVRNTELFSSPHGDFSFSIGSTVWRWWLHRTVFVPSRGFLFFYYPCLLHGSKGRMFSSPHGDFSFSINEYEALKALADIVFVPSRGFLFFYSLKGCERIRVDRFSSPHGDFSFSICFNLSNNHVTFVFVPSRGFLFFYWFCFVRG